MHSLEAIELKPWAIVTQNGPVASLALWRIVRSSTPVSDEATTGVLSSLEEQPGELALAMFSSQERAEEYQQHRVSARAAEEPMQLIQLDQRQLLQVFMAGYRQGMRYAALDPGCSTARQIFVLRDVLLAAQQRLKEQTETQAN